MRFRASAALMFLLAAIALPPAAHAITACNVTCNSNCSLEDDLKCCSDAELCDGAGPIVLANGADLDLAGHTLHCYCGTKTCIGGGNNNVECSVTSECPGGTCGNDTGCTDCDGLVSMSDSNSIVKNTGGAAALISGNPTNTTTKGVKCNSKTGSRVTGVRLQNIAGDAALNCAKVDENLFLPGAVSGTAIRTSGVASSDFIRDNYIEGWTTGIVVTGTQPLTVENNFVSMRAAGTGVDVSGYAASGLTVRNNIVTGSSGTAITGDAGATITASYCNPGNATADCTVAVPPFTLP